jgi:hypothetical protein
MTEEGTRQAEDSIVITEEYPRIMRAGRGN